MAYVFTASKPSSIRIACKARFLSTNFEVLVTVSSNLLHIYHPHTLNPSHEITCYGRVSTVTPFRHWDSRLDLLFVTTEDQKYFTLAFAEGKVITGVVGDLTTKGLTTPDMGHKVIVNGQYIILYLYNGIISVIPIVQNDNPRKRTADARKVLDQPQQLRLDQLKIHDIAMLEVNEKATFGVLYRDTNLTTHLKSYEIHARRGDVELRKGVIELTNLEHGTSMIISRKGKGVLCVGESVLYTMSANSNQMEYPISTPTLFNSKTGLGADEFVLGDDYGLLYSLTFTGARPVLSQIPLPKDRDTAISNISIPHVLVPFDGELFLGSHYGDSQLLRYPSLDVIARKNNIGPIQDILVENSDIVGSSASLITASGAYKDGSLKVVTYGVGMSDKAELEIENVRAIWGIDKLAIIVVGFVDSYIALQVSPDGEIEQVSAGSEEPLFACSMNDNLVIVTRNELQIQKDNFVIGTHPLKLATTARSYRNRLYILDEGRLDIWQFHGDVCDRIDGKKFESEISTFELAHDTAILGFWTTNELWFGDLDLNQVHTEQLNSSFVPHSILLQEWPAMSTPILLVGTNDGSLLTYAFNPVDRFLSNKKQSVLGTTPVSLHAFLTAQGTNVFAVSDRPTIIYSSRGKVAFSSCDVTSCTYFTSFNCAALQCSMILATESGLRIGGIDDIQKLQFRSINLTELPRRLVKSGNTIGALTMRMQVEQSTGNETQQSYLKIFDANNLDKLDEFELQENEMCQSLCHLEVDGKHKFVVGTSFADDEQDECTRGRIIIFGTNVVSSSLWLESQVEVPGSVYCIASIKGRLVAGINSFVRLYDVTSDSIKEVSKFRVSTFALTIAVQNNMILIGDLMKSVCYLSISPSSGELHEVARDYVPAWMTSVSFADAETFLGAEAEGNLILLVKSDLLLEEINTQTNLGRLERVGEFRYGEMINKLVPGVLVMPEDTTIVTPHTLFGTVDGSIGVIGSINTEHVDLLVRLQSSIGAHKHAVGGLQHAHFRAFTCPGTTNTAPLRFVDGDLIEEFLELTGDIQQKVAHEVGKSVDELEKIVENLARLR